ncbi:hypothetical protein BS78_01G009600, partial [Paspalum vaginatum]
PRERQQCRRRSSSPPSRRRRRLTSPSVPPPSKLSSPPERKPAPPPPRPTPQPPRHGAPSCATARPRPPSTPAKNAFMAPRGVQTVHPARRLAPGTAVYVRTTFRQRNVRCRVLLWLRARVVSASDAYHCTVKYAADLNEMFAGRVVSKPVEHVRVAPHRTMAPAAPGTTTKTKAPAPSLLLRR